MATFKAITKSKKDGQKEDLFFIITHIEELDYFVTRVIDGENRFNIDKQYLEDVIQELNSYLSEKYLEVKWEKEVKPDENTLDILEKLRKFK